MRDIWAFDYLLYANTNLTDTQWCRNVYNSQYQVFNIELNTVVLHGLR